MHCQICHCLDDAGWPLQDLASGRRKLLDLQGIVTFGEEIESKQTEAAKSKLAQTAGGATLLAALGEVANSSSPAKFCTPTALAEDAAAPTNAKRQRQTNAPAPGQRPLPALDADGFVME